MDEGRRAPRRGRAFARPHFEACNARAGARGDRGSKPDRLAPSSPIFSGAQASPPCPPTQWGHAARPSSTSFTTFENSYFSILRGVVLEDLEESYIRNTNFQKA